MRTARAYVRAIILSLQPKWAELICAGKKTIELRRRFPCYLAGSQAYIYVSSPICSLTMTVQIGAVHKLRIDELFRIHGKASCVDQGHFAAYFQQLEVGYAIEIARYAVLRSEWDLRRLREMFGFAPPQSWGYASPELISAIGMQS